MVTSDFTSRSRFFLLTRLFCYIFLRIIIYLTEFTAVSQPEMTSPPNSLNLNGSFLSRDESNFVPTVLLGPLRLPKMSQMTYKH